MSHTEPEPEPTPEDSDDSEDGVTQLADPDDYHRKQRLKEIHKRRQNVHKIAEEIDRFTSTDEHSRQRANLNDAISLYITELEPLIDRTEESPELPDALPWDSVSAFADTIGDYHDEDGEWKTAGYRSALIVFRQCNRYLASVKPLIEEDETDEWEI